jgi:hypothetical protein
MTVAAQSTHARKLALHARDVGCAVIAAGSVSCAAVDATAGVIFLSAARACRGSRAPRLANTRIDSDFQQHI